MTDTSSNNKRIAKNTGVLYFRMILIMLVSLYTSRVVLAQLGIVDYGIYNVVGGIVTMFAFLNSSMATATQRFMNFELGKGNKEKLKQVFATSLNIHLIIGGIIILLSETVGMWFLFNKMVIPEDRLVAANWVFQFSILTFFVNILQVPYNAVIIAHERMNVYAYISIIEVILRLGLVFLLSVVTSDKLQIYAILMFAVQTAIRIIYQVYCRRNFEECRFQLFFYKRLFKEMFYFAGWNILGSLAWLLRGQGLNLLLNMFFGPVVNAAQGVASQVSSAMSSFVSNFQVALNPQITKNYASGKYTEMELLAYRGVKFSTILLFAMALPIILNIDFILSIWLETVPEYASGFVVFMIVDSILNGMFGSPFITSLSATGNIRNYQITVSLILLLIIPTGYVFLRFGYNPYAVYFICIAITLIGGFARYGFCVKLIGYSPSLFLRYVLMPLIYTIAVSVPIPLVISFVLKGWVKLFVVSGVSVLTIALATWCIALRQHERETAKVIIKRKINKRK